MADKPSDAETEIEVTPEMIEAGCLVLLNRLWGTLDDVPDYVIREVFVAMVGAAARGEEIEGTQNRMPG
ncbi:hypothetical protein [Shumkonia mesophila]|uniref:hypothetical protein n=1 Tax=Shumkonia mesophila TaxID=2838854 RepID=UPI002934AA77|nr:hypothetical protein [Shumkonia mesophila]